MIETLKTEIIEAEKSRIDLLKWKVIIVAALGTVGLGIDPVNCADALSSVSGGPTISMSLVLALIPPVATYVDLLCTHLQLRILVIGKHFQDYQPQTTDDEISCFFSYERFCGSLRSIFDFEDWAQVGSTLVLLVLVSIVAYLVKLPEAELWILWGSSGIGLALSLIVLLFSFRKKRKICKGEKGEEKTGAGITMSTRVGGYGCDYNK